MFVDIVVVVVDVVIAEGVVIFLKSEVDVARIEAEVSFVSVNRRIFTPPEERWIC